MDANESNPKRNGIPYDNINDEFEALFTGKTVKFPLFPIFIMLICVILITPTYPTEEISYRWSAWDGRGSSVTNFDLQPPLVIMLNGFEWHDNYFFFGSIDGGTSSSHTASPLPMVAYLLAILILGGCFWQMKRKNKNIIVEETNGQFSLMFYGFFLLAVGLYLSVGLFTSILIGNTGPLPIDSWGCLMIIFVVIAPIILFLSFYFLHMTSRLQVWPTKVDDLTTSQRLFPVSFSTFIIIFLIMSFMVQASIPHTEPISINEYISVMSIADMNVTSSTSVEIIFGTIYPGSYADNLKFVLSSYSHGGIDICWPESINGSNTSMDCYPSNITAIFQSQEYITSPIIKNGDKLVISNLYPNETYRFCIYNSGIESLIPITGQDTFSLPGGR